MFRFFTVFIHDVSCILVQYSSRDSAYLKESRLSEPQSVFYLEQEGIPFRAPGFALTCAYTVLYTQISATWRCTP